MPRSRENLLPYSILGEIIQEAAGKRVSRDAREGAAQILEELAAKIVRKAVLLSENAGRKTLKAKDIQLAYQQIKEEL
ncbi:MAG: NFYB/HAP3 family transcription factor subunit [Candidatus Woesearchaeota archaeon]|nr:NFYB/HAP3 family transcription factor subunit [Nanoarchaeota archaeon]USN44276.1 MAG: NFYB/HAP3 family transcription factor subunit [Candidatus Woesearchaeota archaeon]